MNFRKLREGVAEIGHNHHRQLGLVDMEIGNISLDKVIHLRKGECARSVSIAQNFNKLALTDLYLSIRYPSGKM